MLKSLHTQVETLGKILFGTLMIGVLAFVFGPGAYAHFARSTGPIGWGVGDGYGYGLGYGWDEGLYAGYAFAGTDDVFDFQAGYGLLLDNGDGETSSSDGGSHFDIDWNSLEAIDGCDPVGLCNLIYAGLAAPVGGLTGITFHIPHLTLHLGSESVVILPFTSLGGETGGDLTTFDFKSSVSSAGLSGAVRGTLGFGLDTVPLTVTNVLYGDTVLINMSVSSSLNGQELDVYRREPNAEPGDWNLIDSCTVAGGICQFDTDTLSSFAAVGGTIASGGSGSSSTPTVTLSQPNGGESFAEGSTQQIIWGSSGSTITGVRLSLSTDSGSSFPTVIATNVVNNGFYNWTVPGVATSDARIKVEVLQTGGSVAAVAVSASDFTITVSGESGSDDDDTTPGTTPPPPTGGPSSAGAHSRFEANNLLPDGYDVDSLVRTVGNPALYYIGLDAKRHPFLTLPTYQSWHMDFSQVKMISDSTLASIPFGAPVLVRPGTFWVKIVSDPKTYYVEPGYRLRWIKDEATARMLGGENWNQRIIDVDPSLFTLFTVGSDITLASLSSSWPNGALVQSPGIGDVCGPCYVTATGRRPVSSSGFDANMFQQRFVQVSTTAAGWASMPVESAVTAFEDVLFSLMH